MSYSSKQFLQHAENIATGIEAAKGGGYRRPQHDRNKWLDNLNDAERERLKREYEYEISKLQYQWLTNF